jgi:hypothetical protein
MAAEVVVEAAKVSLLLFALPRPFLFRVRNSNSSHRSLHTKTQMVAYHKIENRVAVRERWAKALRQLPLLIREPV